MKHRCVVYDSLGNPLFQEEGVSMASVAVTASERVRDEYPTLVGVAWEFERIQPEYVSFQPDDGLEDWDKHVRAYRAELEANDE